MVTQQEIERVKTHRFLANRLEELTMALNTLQKDEEATVRIADGCHNRVIKIEELPVKRAVEESLISIIEDIKQKIKDL